MPIVKDADFVEIEFGTGDIEVAPALLKCDEVIGAVCLFQRKYSNPIGERGEYEPNMIVEREHTPVRLTFSKTESIDVLVRVLQETKALMIEKINPA